jgi:hypothetical protein
LELADENWRKDEKMAARRNEEKQSERLSLGQPLKATGDYTPQMSRRQV